MQSSIINLRTTAVFERKSYVHSPVYRVAIAINTHCLTVDGQDFKRSCRARGTYTHVPRVGVIDIVTARSPLRSDWTGDCRHASNNCQNSRPETSQSWPQTACCFVTH